jgi:rod shape-determining protein MreD
MKKYWLSYILAIISQIFLSNLISVGGVKPDIIIIFLIYFSLNQGSFKGATVGFITGLGLSLFDNRSSIGLLPLVYSIVGYGFGLLKNYKGNMSSIQFNIFCYLIIVFTFFVYSYFLFDSIFYNDLTTFVVYWIKNMVYTLVLIIIFQFIIPFKK